MKHDPSLLRRTAYKRGLEATCVVDTAVAHTRARYYVTGSELLPLRVWRRVERIAAKKWDLGRNRQLLRPSGALKA